MPAPVQAATSLNQFGITWTFNTNYQTGQFANGDNWVIGPVTIIGISPASTPDGSGRTMNGSMLNPSPTNTSQGYDSAMAYNTYSASLNKALNVSAGNPLVLQPGSSLVSTISVAAGNSRPQIQTAAILTVLSSAPAAGSFRPPYCGSDKSIKFNASQLNYSLLKSLAPVTGTLSLATVEAEFERPWIDHQNGWTGRYQHPVSNMPDYGDQISRQIGDGALMLHLNFTNAQKATLLTRYVQLGIDLYGIVQAGGYWADDGGHASGRKWPILFAGLMLGDNNMKNITIKSGDYLYKTPYGPGNPPPDYIHFGEDDQTFYVSSSDLSISHYYPPNSADYAEYISADIGLPEWGIRHAVIPSYDGRDWDDAAYRTSNTANAWAGFVLAAQIMNQKAAWNHNALFDYQDRYMAIEKSLGKTGTWNRQWSGFSENMWDAYRASYGCVWTRTNTNDIWSNGKTTPNNNLEGLVEFAVFANNWGKTSTSPILTGDIFGPNGTSDGRVDTYDLSAFCDDYLTDTQLTNNSNYRLEAFSDFAVLAGNWGKTVTAGQVLAGDISGPNGVTDNRVDVYDLVFFCENYLMPVNY